MQAPQTDKSRPISNIRTPVLRVLISLISGSPCVLAAANPASNLISSDASAAQTQVQKQAQSAHQQHKLGATLKRTEPVGRTADQLNQRRLGAQRLSEVELSDSAWKRAAPASFVVDTVTSGFGLENPSTETFDTVVAASDKPADPLLPAPADDPKKMPRYLSALPRLFATAPTLLPKESGQSKVAPLEQTAHLSWVDDQHAQMHQWIDDTSVQINSWFSDEKQIKPASAALRVILDQAYSPTDGYDVNLRVRGKIRLPALEDKVSVVFGDDRLDDELGTQTDPANPALDDTQRSLSLRQTREENSSIALRISAITEKLPFESDLDFGLRSGDDPYVRFKLDRSFELPEDFNFYAAQIYRYGAQSKEYLQTNLELAHAPPGLALIANQLKITSSDEEADDIRISNRMFRQHRFYKNQRFQYGLYQGGYVDSGEAKLNAWGPYTSWRQPVLREWFYVQTDLNYFNDKRDNIGHEASGLLRLEALF